MKGILELAGKDPNVIYRTFEQYAYEYLKNVKGFRLGNINQPLDLEKYNAVYKEVGDAMKPELDKMYKEIDDWIEINNIK